MKDQLTLLISVNETSVSNTYVCMSVCLFPCANQIHCYRQSLLSMKYSQRHGRQKGMFFNIEVVKSLNYNICSCHYYHECISLGGQLSFQYFPTSYGDMLIWGDQELFYCSNEGCTEVFFVVFCFPLAIHIIDSICFSVPLSISLFIC